MADPQGSWYLLNHEEEGEDSFLNLAPWLAHKWDLSPSRFVSIFSSVPSPIMDMLSFYQIEQLPPRGWSLASMQCSTSHLECRFLAPETNYCLFWCVGCQVENKGILRFLDSKLESLQLPLKTMLNLSDFYAVPAFIQLNM